MHTPDALTTMEVGYLQAYEGIIERGLRQFVEVGNALAAIRDSRLYRQDYATFDAYCEARWNLKHSRAYQLMDAATVVENLVSSTIVDLPTRESQVRPLVKLEPTQQVETWREVIKHTSQPPAALVEKAARHNRSGSRRSDSRLEDMPKPERWRILTGKRVILEQALQLLSFDLDDPVPVAIDAEAAEGAAYEVLESSLVERLARKLVQE